MHGIRYKTYKLEAVKPHSEHWRCYSDDWRALKAFIILAKLSHLLMMTNS